MTLTKAVQELRGDPDFCRGFRRGIGLVLAAFVVSQCLICAFYPLIRQPQGVSGQAPQSTPTPAFRIFLPIICSPPPSKGVGLSGPCSAVEMLGVDWYYNWGIRPCEVDDLRYVPMIYGEDQMINLPQAIAIAQSGSGWLLGFNEPNEPTQSNISPGKAAELWYQIEAQAEGIKLVSPVPSQDDPDWLWRMVAEYEMLYGEKPHFDAIAAHYYDFPPTDPNDTKAYLSQVRQQALAHGYDMPIWLTEWAGSCWLPDPDNGNHALMEELIPWMEAQLWMGRYAWFASRLPNPPWTLNMEVCSLTDPGTFQLTSLGELYRGF